MLLHAKSQRFALPTKLVSRTAAPLAKRFVLKLINTLVGVVVVCVVMTERFTNGTPFSDGKMI